MKQLEGLILTLEALTAIRAEVEGGSAPLPSLSQFHSNAVHIPTPLPFPWSYNEVGPFYFVPLQLDTINKLAAASFEGESPSDTILRIIANHRGVH